MEKEELGNCVAGDSSSGQCCSTRIMSPEIVEIGEDSRSFASNNRDSSGGNANDIYVAVGKDDMDVLKWALDHLVCAGARVFLVHIFPPITYIPTPVGRLSRSQLSQEQVRVYVNEETNRRRNILQKYIRLCSDAKVPVDTMLTECNVVEKAIVDLIPVLNITHLVIGTKRPPYSRRLTKKLPKGEFVKKNAPEFCEVTIVHNGQKVLESRQMQNLNHPPETSRNPKPEVTGKTERNLFECMCFSVCRPKIEEIQDCICPKKAVKKEPTETEMSNSGSRVKKRESTKNRWN